MLLASVPMGPEQWNPRTLPGSQGPAAGKSSHTQTHTPAPPLPSSPHTNQTGQTPAVPGPLQTLPPGPRTCQAPESRPTRACVCTCVRMCTCMCVPVCTHVLVFLIGVSQVTFTHPCVLHILQRQHPQTGQSQIVWQWLLNPVPGEPLSLCPSLEELRAPGPPDTPGVARQGLLAAAEGAGDPTLTRVWGRKETPWA